MHRTNIFKHLLIHKQKAISLLMDYNCECLPSLTEFQFGIIIFVEQRRNIIISLLLEYTFKQNNRSALFYITVFFYFHILSEIFKCGNISKPAKNIVQNFPTYKKLKDPLGKTLLRIILYTKKIKFHRLWTYANLT